MRKIICILLMALLVQSSFSLFAFAEDEGVYIDLQPNNYYAAEDLSSVTVGADGIFDSVKIMVDYELRTEISGNDTIDLSDLTNGRHLITALLYQNGEKIADDSVRIFVVEQQENVLWENDLTDYQSAGEKLPNGISGSYGSARGTATIKNKEDVALYGGEHGVVALQEALVGADKQENGAYWQFSNSNKGVTTVEFDIFISALTAKYNFQLRYVSNGTKLKTIGSINNSNISSVISTVNTPYEKNCWYHLKFEVDMLQSTSSLTVNKENETDPILQTGTQSLDLDVAEANFRMTLSASAGQTVNMALDNFKLSESVTSPIITAIHSEAEENIVLPEQNKVILALNRALQADTVTADTVQVYLQAEDRKALVKSVVCENQSISIKFAEELLPSLLYRVELLSTIVDDKGSTLGTSLVDWFETSSALLDVINPEVINDGTSKKVKGTMIDTDATGAPLIAVLSVWNGDRLVDISYQTIFAGDFTTNAVSCSAENTLQLLVYNPVTGKTMIKL